MLGISSKASDKEKGSISTVKGLFLMAFGKTIAKVKGKLFYSMGISLEGISKIIIDTTVCMSTGMGTSFRVIGRMI